LTPADHAGAGPLAAWGRFVAVHKRWVLGGWLVAAVVMAGFSVTTPRLLSPGNFNADIEAQRAIDLMRQQFPDRRLPAYIAVLHSDTVPATDPGFVAQAAAWHADIQRLARATGADAMVSDPVPGKDGHTAAIVMTSSQAPDTFVDFAKSARDVNHGGPATVYRGGLAAIYDAFLNDSENDLQTSERISLPVALLLLLLVFGGLVAAGLPVITGLATVTAAVALLGFVARVHTVSVFALNITTVVGLGLGIDYSFLVVNRFRDELRAGYSVNEAVGRTVRTAGLATAVSGGTVLIGFGALMLSNINVLWSLGLGGACVVGVSVLASLTLIPALLALFGHRVNRLALPYTQRTATARFWSALAHAVMRRPLLFIAASLAVTVVIALPALHLNQGVIGSESLPPGDPAVTAERLASDQFAISPYQPILVVARGVTDAAGAAAVKQQLIAVTGGNAVRSVADVSAAQAAQYLRPPYAIFEVAQTAADNDPATRDLLDRIRGTRWSNGVTALVGGEAAAYQDFLRLMAHDLPVIVAVVVGLTMLLLGIVFRSVVLPIKAVLMNMLSVGAGIGVLVWIFQEGHLASQLDVQAVGFIDATIPPIIFAAVFGLSMDYEVFLLSRVREEHLGGRDNTDAVATGVARTGQIVTSAALIMIVVFSSLALSHLSINKSFGITFAVAIFLDATVIRLFLVPAMMRVMGRVNWWPGGR
jgi:uncharacterized membrane protein YdfJ with MMPL/SSD domain